MLNLGSLNPQQRLAVETTGGPVLILAGAGTGKTRVITHRIAYLIEKGVAPQNVLAVTFTNKAAREMQERVRQLLPKTPRSRATKPERPTISTFHSLCVRILREHIEKLGYKRNFVIYDESEQLAVMKRILSHISVQGEKADPREVLGVLSRFKNEGSSRKTLAEPNLAALAEHVRKHYESALRACNAVDFDDLILLTLKLFAEHPSALEACRERFRYVMVDEYQDTNASQFQLVHALAREHRNLCVVGDDDQSIYGWRGAEIANLLDLEKFFSEVKVVKLEQNYRSTNVILEAANAVIRNNPRRRGKTLWSNQGAGCKITLHAFATEETEARTMAEEIEYARLMRRIPWSEQAILFRTNQQSRPLETALRQAGVRYHLIGGQSFFDRREIRDFLAYLKLFLNPDDDISLLRVANVPPRGLSDVTMERLLAASQERNCSVYAAMRNPVVEMTFPAKARQSIGEFVRLIEGFRGELHAAGELSLAAWANRFLAETGYAEYLRRTEKDADTADNRIQNLADLIATLGESADAALVPTERLERFLEDLALDADQLEKEPEGDAVTLITMHSCKGLEFPHVSIVGLEDGLLPHARSKLEGTLDEERRLFYVAVTRAMRTLSISHCGGRKKYGEIVPCHPSPFLKELPEHLVEWADEKGKQPVSVDSGKSLFDGLRATLG